MSVLKAVSSNENHQENAQSINLAKHKIPANGDFLDLLDEVSVNNAISRYKQHLKKRGFHCFALGRYLWIVPSMHRELGVPDFERAKATLPDLRGELLHSLSTGQRKPFKFKLTIRSFLWLIVGLVALNVASQIIMPML